MNYVDKIIIKGGKRLISYKKQVEEIAKYFKDNEKEEKDFKIGVEFEHFIIDKDTLETISYYGPGGVEETLNEMLPMGWEGNYEGGHLLGLSRDGNFVALEPGSQFELSVRPEKNIEDIKKIYFDFLNEVIPILEKKNQVLINTGYQPETKIADIKRIPKKRYKYMYEYFKTRGSHAHNMMKGTGALQASFDYSSEEDYAKKLKVASSLSPVMYAMFDNTFYFEQKPQLEKRNLRSFIWENCDSDRCGVVDGVLDKVFEYKDYAEYVLNGPPIFIDDGKSLYYTGAKKYKEIFDPNNYTIEELEHVLTMFFLDVRCKKYIEIRVFDSIPYPLNFAAVALWKGIFYNENNLNKVHKYVENITTEDINKSKMEIIDKGLDAKLGKNYIHEISKELITISKTELTKDEIKYIEPLEEMINEKKTPYDITKEKYKLGKKEALDWCIIDKNFLAVN